MSKVQSRRPGIVGKEPLTGAAADLDAAMRKVDVSKLSQEERENVVRLCSAMIADIRQQQRHDNGWTQKSWDKQGPDQKAASTDAAGVAPELGILFDHESRFVHQDGRVEYMIEPYELSPDKMQRLLALASDWDITVRADRGFHFPARCLDVTFEHKQGKG